MNYNNIEIESTETLLEELALDIVEAGQDITPQQLEQLKAHPQLEQLVSELLQAKAQTKLHEQGGVDVESRLVQFHQNQDRREHEEERKTSHVKLYSLLSLAVAAVVMALLFYAPLSAFFSSSDKEGEQVLFAAVEETSPVSVLVGEEPLVTEPSQNQASGNSHIAHVSVDDYKEAYSKTMENDKVVVKVPYGRCARIDLPDGSVAWLHPNSKLNFPAQFIGGKRVVSLQGEAYFKVAKDAVHPFIVLSEGIETTVLGTEFNVAHDRVVLISGRVSVKVEKANASFEMKPGEKLVVTDDSYTVAPTDTLPYTYWRDGFLYYDNMTIGDIMRCIGENYNMTVEIRPGASINQQMRFIAERDSGIETTIKQMNSMRKVHVIRQGGKIVVE